MRFKILNQRDKQAVSDYINALPFNKRYDVDIVVHREKRSLDQNRLLFLWLNCIASETGNDKDYLHTFFKNKFLDPSIKYVFGEPVYREPTTTTLDTKQFTDYLEKIRVFAASELGIILPDPEDSIWNQFYEQYSKYV